MEGERKKDEHTLHTVGFINADRQCRMTCNMTNRFIDTILALTVSHEMISILPCFANVRNF